MPPVPLLLLSDSITSSTGLGRITRELAVRINRDLGEEFRVATSGYGGNYSRKYPFPQYPLSRLENWTMPELPAIWNDFAGTEPGIIMAIWNASWLPWLANPGTLPNGELRTFLLSTPIQRWGYFPVDADGPNSRLPRSQCDIMAGFDRVATYTEWAKGVIDRTAAAFKRHFDCAVLPHGTESEIFSPRSRETARRDFIARVVQQNRAGVIDPKTLLLGVIATNTPRKDWPLAFETCRELLNRGVEVGLWAHTDDFRKYWDLPTLADEFGMAQRVIFTNTHLSDDDLAWGMAACDVTLGIGSGEGWGLPISESLAMGIPAIHGDFAGAAEFLPGEFKVRPAAFRYDGHYSNRRPVFHARDWAECVLAAKGKECSLDQKYLWDVPGGAWETWKVWLLKGRSDASAGSHALL